MKKFTVLALAVLLLVAFTVPASAAVENVFGGYWRTRMFMNKNFDGEDTETKDITAVDTRTRLFYTAKIHDKLKFVSAFEMDSVWGTGVQPASKAYGGSYGKTGTDANAIEIKHLYADFNVGPVNAIVGAQPFKLARGFISDEDGIGMKLIWKVNDGLYLPFIWQKFYEGHDGYPDPVGGKDLNDKDIDMYILTPIIMLSKDIKLNPYYVYITSKQGLVLSTIAPAFSAGSFDDVDIHVFGLDFDGKFGAASVWFTGIMQAGSSSATGAASTAGITPGTDIDMAGYLFALGGKFDMGKADVHGQFFYASGDDDGLADREVSAYTVTASQFYYWAEILGYGIFDEQVPAGSLGFRTSNVMAANVGAKFAPMDKLSVTADLWYAKLAEEKVFANGKKADELGIEADLVLTYKLLDNLNLDIVAAYLFAGDAISADGGNDKDPYELGTRLSLSF
jgi:hypothetical protein